MAEIVRSAIDPSLELKRGGSAHATRSHAHEGPSISLVESGSTSLAVGHDYQTLLPGDFVYIPAGIVHLCSPEDNVGFRYATLNIPATWSLRLGSRIPMVRMGHASPNKIVAAFMKIIDGTSYEEAIKLLHNLTEPLSVSEGRLLRSFRVAPIPLDPRAALNPSKNGYRGFSRYQRYRVLKEEYGVGEQSIAHIRRVELSKKLLRQGGSIVDAALYCGYFDQSHFTKAFRNYTGLTPAQYKLAQ
ncbi:MAG: helix-turn-helix domain-containing protein [Spirochaetes bacterium]|jgi:hypothetical protein|nr:helix-turn-helix domain-containing protein [Spirochaetota bacterium]